MTTTMIAAICAVVIIVIVRKQAKAETTMNRKQTVQVCDARMLNKITNVGYIN
jgi:hypothetical protein